MQRNADKIQAFEIVLYKPNNTEDPFKKGKLLSCVYRLNNRKFLDIRLPTTDNKAYITNSKNWHAAYGENQYECAKSRLAYEFHLSK